MSRNYKTTEWNNKKGLLGEGPLDPNKPVKILIGFHGAESTPENMLIHGNRLQLENTFMLFPEGPVDSCPQVKDEVPGRRGHHREAVRARPAQPRDGAA